MKKQNLVIMLVVGLVLLGGSFYVGMQYGAKNVSKAQLAQQSSRNGSGNFGGGANVGQRGAAGQGAQGGGQRGGANAGGSFATGQIVAKDDTSITIKTNDGGSKIVFFSGSTGIDKSVSGTNSDLSVGQQVTVSGKASADGSVVAQSIQIRPTQPAQPAQ